MTAVLGGLVAALAWGLAPIFAARASRAIGAWSATAWVVLIGLLATLPLLLVDAPIEDVAADEFGWLVIAGVAYVGGLMFTYAALAGGKIPVTAPIVSTEGAIAAILAILAGEPSSPLFMLMLGLITAGIFVAALRPGGGLDSLAGDGARFVGFAVIAAIVFGVGLYASGRASSAVPAAWVVAAGRIAGVLLLTLPLLLTRRLRFDRAVLPFLVVAGVAEVVGVYAFAWGARESIAVAAIVSAQFAVVSAVLAHALGERISGRQWLGVAAVAIGVTAITLSQL